MWKILSNKHILFNAEKKSFTKSIFEIINYFDIINIIFNLFILYYIIYIILYMYTILLS